MIPPISMLKIQELSGAMPLDPHRGSAPGSCGPCSAAIEGLPPAQAPPLDTALIDNYWLKDGCLFLPSVPPPAAIFL